MRTQLSLAVIALVLVGASACATKETRFSLDSPESTFLSWKQAASQLDIESLLETYSSRSRPSIEDELARATDDALRTMARETRQTRFEIERVIFEDQVAYLRVRRRFGPINEVEVITMIKEGENWKIQP